MPLRLRLLLLLLLLLLLVPALPIGPPLAQQSYSHFLSAEGKCPEAAAASVVVVVVGGWGLGDRVARGRKGTACEHLGRDLSSGLGARSSEGRAQGIHSDKRCPALTYIIFHTTSYRSSHESCFVAVGASGRESVIISFPLFVSFSFLLLLPSFSSPFLLFSASVAS